MEPQSSSKGGGAEITDHMLNQIIQKITVTYESKHSSVYNQVRQALEQSPLKIRNIVPGGSYAKGTMVNYDIDVKAPNSSSTAAFVKSDIDMAVVLSKVDLLPFSRMVKSFAEIAKEWLRFSIKALDGSDKIKVTSHGVTFELDNVGVDVNLAPDYDPTYKRLEKEDSELWRWASNCFIDAQVERFRRLSSTAKDWIRLVKYWKYRFQWPETDAEGKEIPKLPSYLLEIVAIHVIAVIQKQYCHSPKQFFEAFLEMLSKANTWDIAPQDIEPRIPQAVREHRPFVCDLVNPTHNVASRLVDHPELLQSLIAAARHGLAALNRPFRSIDLNAAPKGPFTNAPAASVSSGISLSSATTGPQPIAASQTAAVSSSSSSAVATAKLTQTAAIVPQFSTSTPRQAPLKYAKNFNKTLPLGISWESSLNERFTEAWRNVCLLPDDIAPDSLGRLITSIPTFFNVDPSEFRQALDKEGVLLKEKKKPTRIDPAFRVGLQRANAERAAKFLVRCWKGTLYLPEQVQTALDKAGYSGLDSFQVLQAVQHEYLFPS